MQRKRANAENEREKAERERENAEKERENAERERERENAEKERGKEREGERSTAAAKTEEAARQSIADSVNVGAVPGRCVDWKCFHLGSIFDPQKYPFKVSNRVGTETWIQRAMVVLTENFLLMKTRMQSLAHIR